LAFLSVLVVVFWVFGGFGVFGLDEAEVEAGEAIAEAEAAVLDCYKAVMDAERAGANVTELLGVLNEAGMLLSKSHLAYSIGDFGSARDFAVWCQGNLTGFVEEADDLRDVAMQEGYWDFMVNVVGSAVGAVGVVCSGFAVWFFFKKREESKERI